jgi:RHS repeat-associated protein
VYDTLNRLTALDTTHPASSRTIQSYALTLGPAGNRTRIAEHDGSVRSYAYDEVYRLTGEKVTVDGLADYEKLFTYDGAGNRVAQATTGGGAAGSPTAPGSIAYGYDSRDRLLTETLGTSAPTAYTYDDNGNLVTKAGAVAYAWDTENRLVKVTKADGTVAEHAYDADGNRVQTKVTPATGPPTVTNYLLDTSARLSQVVAETDGAGTLQAAYIRGSDLLAVMRPDGAGGFSERFYHADGLGSIRRLTDETGNITDGYTYTAFGEVVGHTGSDPQPYAFAGEPYDPTGALQYHRARWMDARTGRFLGMDPLDPMVGRLFDPPNLHRYTYAADNPASATDPTGLQTLGELNVSMDVGNTLRGESAVNARAVQLGINRSVGKALESKLEQIVGREFEIIGRQRALTGPGGKRIYDLMVKVGDRLFIIESKTNLPVGGSAFRRLIGQILTYSTPAEAEAAGAEVIVFFEGAAEGALERIVTTLGVEASPYYIQGFVELMSFLRMMAIGI